jgi:hypothetical protein
VGGLRRGRHVAPTRHPSAGDSGVTPAGPGQRDTLGHARIPIATPRKRPRSFRRTQDRQWPREPGGRGVAGGHGVEVSPSDLGLPHR